MALDVKRDVFDVLERAQEKDMAVDFGTKRIEPDYNYRTQARTLESRVEELESRLASYERDTAHVKRESLQQALRLAKIGMAVVVITQTFMLVKVVVQWMIP